jgi:hypothetical protein
MTPSGDVRPRKVKAKGGSLGGRCEDERTPGPMPLASTEAMLAAGARVVVVDRDEAALTALREKHGDAVISAGHRSA